MTTYLLFAVIGVALFCFVMLPTAIAQGDIFGRDLSYRVHRVERKTRPLRYLAPIVVGFLIIPKYGMLSAQFVPLAIGALVIGPLLSVLLTRASDSAGGATLEDLL